MIQPLKPSTHKSEVNVRQSVINRDFWYPVAWSSEVKPQSILPVNIWDEEIAIYRSADGMLRAVEDACLHKGVSLHLGTVEKDRIVCAYHGWEFDQHGACVRIPYLPEGSSCPKRRLRTFPVQDHAGLIWVLPGDPEGVARIDPPSLAEDQDPAYLRLDMGAHVRAHFSFVDDHTMDVYRGYLHKGLHAGSDPVLLELDQDDARVRADYQVSDLGSFAKLFCRSASKSDANRGVVRLDYRYPDFRNDIEGVSVLYVMRQPIGPRETRSFYVLFVKPWLPGLLWRPFRKQIAWLLSHSILKRHVFRENMMIERAQQIYGDTTHAPDGARAEANPVRVALHRLILQQSGGLITHHSVKITQVVDD